MTNNKDTEREVFNRLGLAEQQIASLDSKMDQVISTLDRVVDKMGEPQPKTDLVAVAALIVAIVSAGAVYLQSRFAPVEKQQDVQAAQIEKIHERELDQARLLGKLEATYDIRARMADDRAITHRDDGDSR